MLTNPRLFHITCSSHFSTRPFASAGTILWTKRTCSFSADSMPRMTVSELKVNWAMPSKHFLRCGWTRRGSFVSDRISSNSSFERKKNLQKTCFSNNTHHPCKPGVVLLYPRLTSYTMCAESVVLCPTYCFGWFWFWELAKYQIAIQGNAWHYLSDCDGRSTANQS